MRFQVAHTRDGASVFESDREMDFNAGVAHHGFMLVEEEFRGRGFNKVFLRNCRSTYQQLGLSRVTVRAGLTQGGYTNARLGFVPSEADWGAISGPVFDNLSAIRPPLGEPMRQGIAQLLAG
jgi:GNAT superfamily N-acetyltransferase